MNVVGIEGEGEGGRGWVVDEVVGVVVEENTSRFGIVGVRERRIGEGDGRKCKSAVARRMVEIRHQRVGSPGGRIYCNFMVTGKDVETVKNSRSGLYEGIFLLTAVKQMVGANFRCQALRHCLVISNTRAK